MKTNKALQARIERALDYPDTDPADYRASFMLARNGGNEFCPPIVPETADAVIDGSVRLAGAQRDVPTWQVTFSDKGGQAHMLQKRVALVGYSSNASKRVLRTKFHDFAAGKDDGFEICVLSAELAGHAVVHGAFIGDSGPIPATLWAEEKTRSMVTLGFYDAAAAAHMTRTEPNYDGILLDAPLKLAKGTQVSNAMAYVAIWGALSDKLIGGKGFGPIALSVVPTLEGKLVRRSSYAVMAALIKAQTGVCPEESAMAAYVRENITNENLRFGRTKYMQENYKLQAEDHSRVAGLRVFSAQNLHRMARLKHA